ncbi:hypothetical protein C2845_PM06G25300 [Panicum miliaceum]|uniref:Uncharacterized protein n=1 Tax=Panicum miliaceum TaxID=4540 RepID=A0A3L6R554_PANMI|nr:hypothetical protein C2845_PM06G25300 [Panicum miliaceum]
MGAPHNGQVAAAPVPAQASMDAAWNACEQAPSFLFLQPCQADRADGRALAAVLRAMTVAVRPPSPVPRRRVTPRVVTGGELMGAHSVDASRKRSAAASSSSACSPPKACRGSCTPPRWHDMTPTPTLSSRRRRRRGSVSPWPPAAAAPALLQANSY